MDSRGTALILVSILLVGLTIFSTELISSSFSENAFAIRYLESTQAFWLAEAGVNHALNNLRVGNLNTINETMGKGGYLVPTIAYDTSTDTYTVTSQGVIPFNPTSFRVERVIEAKMKNIPVPNNFYNTVIWSASDINIKGTGQGNYASVTGDIVCGGDISTSPQQVPIENIVTGETSLNDSTASPLPLLDFGQLRYISKTQNNYYDAQRLSSNPTFPNNFWYNEASKIPNVVFIEGDLALSGGVNVGGFIIVGGNPKDPNDPTYGIYYITTISGNVGIDGCIYTNGDIVIEGGGTNLNIDGAIWAGSVTLKGSITLSYNQTYTQAIDGSGYNTIIQVISWREIGNPYKL